MKIPFSCCSSAWISLIEIVSRLSNGFGLYNKWQEGTHFGPFLWKEKFQIAGDCSLDFQDCFGKFVSKSFQLKLLQLKLLCNIMSSMNTNHRCTTYEFPTVSTSSSASSRVGLFINRTFSTFVAKNFFKFCIQNKNCFCCQTNFCRTRARKWEIFSTLRENSESFEKIFESWAWKCENFGRICRSIGNAWKFLSQQPQSSSVGARHCAENEKMCSDFLDFPQAGLSWELVVQRKCPNTRFVSRIFIIHIFLLWAFKACS